MTPQLSRSVRALSGSALRRSSNSDNLTLLSRASRAECNNPGRMKAGEGVSLSGFRFMSRGPERRWRRRPMTDEQKLARAMAIAEVAMPTRDAAAAFKVSIATA
jgi:hypothetical protein